MEMEAVFRAAGGHRAAYNKIEAGSQYLVSPAPRQDKPPVPSPGAGAPHLHTRAALRCAAAVTGTQREGETASLPEEEVANGQRSTALLALFQILPGEERASWHRC